VPSEALQTEYPARGLHFGEIAALPDAI
jgi:hypothetical protein